MAVSNQEMIDDLAVSKQGQSIIFFGIITIMILLVFPSYVTTSILILSFLVKLFSYISQEKDRYAEFTASLSMDVNIEKMLPKLQVVEPNADADTVKTRVNLSLSIFHFPSTPTINDKLLYHTKCAVNNYDFLIPENWHCENWVAVIFTTYYKICDMS